MPEYDLAVVGGGIAGLGVFASAARSGLKTLLLERGRVGGATTAVTSALFHGGLRYLPYDAGTSYLMCREIERMRRERPDLLTRQAFLWPIYRGQRPGMGFVESLLEYYDLFQPLRGGALHARLSARETREILPELSAEGLVGALAFDEWRVDVPGLVGSLAQAGRAAGGELLEGWRVTGLDVRAGRVAALRAAGPEGEAREFSAKVFVNAAGPWAEEVAGLAGSSLVRLTLRKGVHLVVPGESPGYGLIFPGPGGRYIGVFPRPGETWVGPSDDPYDGSPDAVAATPREEEDIRGSLARVLPGLASRPCRSAAGLRPLFRQRGAAFLLSRDHRVTDHAREGLANLLTLTGGKLTSCRHMGEDVTAAILAKLGRLAPTPRAGPACLPWGLLRSRSRWVNLAVSLGLLSFFTARRALGLGGGRRGRDRDKL